MARLEPVVVLEGVAIEVAIEELVERRSLGMVRTVDAAWGWCWYEHGASDGEAEDARAAGEDPGGRAL